MTRPMSKPAVHTIVGQPIPLKDAALKVTGSLEFAVDVQVSGMVHGKILRSPHASARILSIDTRRAESLPGVLGVVTHADAPKVQWENCWHNHVGRILDDHVRFVGDEVAAVAAVSEAIAAEALDLIDIDYEILAAVVDASKAMAPDAPQVRPEGNARPPFEVIWGDVDEGAEESDVIVEGSMTFGSQAYAPIGGNACVAQWKAGRVTVWTSTQTPSEMRDSIAAALEIPISSVRVIAQPCGSSFGLWWIGAMQMVTVLLARKVGRPVRIALDSEESFATVKRRHEERSWGRLGCSDNGTITFVDVNHLHDNGGYGMKPDVGFLTVDLWGRPSHGRYVVQGVSTNRVTAGCMRGVGDVTLGAFIERLLDQAAIELNMDPLEFRLTNHIRVGDPLRAAALGEPVSPEETVPSDSGESPEGWPALGQLASEGLHTCLADGAAVFGWSDRWAGWGAPSSVEGPLRRGIGVATAVHSCGTEDEYGASALVRIHADGSATLACSMGRQGQGSETTQAQIAAEALGISIDQIMVEAGDTDVCPPNHGSIASNTAYRTGFATWSAACDARSQIQKIAANHAGSSNPEDFMIANQVVASISDPAISFSLPALLTELEPGTQTPPTVVGRTITPMPPAWMYARYFAAHFVEIEVDTDTGEIRLIDYLAAQDSGTVLNPKVLENQVLGAAIMGSGFALTESLIFDPDTGRIQNPGFLDYKVMRAPDFPVEPKVIFSEPYDPVGPFGAKSAGEAPAGAPIPAISQALYNAVGVWLDVPMTPERVLAALGTI